ncbi:hypothetical protein ACJZTR_00410 [Neorickettsia risticii]|uniref:Uncharacterized protein n=1 Tax=Neorickettsia risticii (strain Illinois) TaxID=434131 RepID=C6V3X9_NEORI|nr:hypothetical protein [Neorickettsia risticii]ACT69102.1 hypothetical protein NRI_0097 [Neorickettsia risticii str. Illinois]
MSPDKVLLLCAFCCLAVFMAVAIALAMRGTTQGTSVEQVSSVSNMGGDRGKGD